MKISILCPTRGRPESMKRLAFSALNTASDRANVEVIFYIDNDDITSKELIGKLKTDQIRAVYGERITLSDMWNACIPEAKGEVYMQCGDDVLFETMGWDKIVRDKFLSIPDRIAFIYGSDGIQPFTYGTHGFLHRNWVNTVGYFLPPGFTADYSDTWLNDVAWLIGRKFYIPILTTHLHHSAGKAPIDQTTQELLEKKAATNPQQLYNDRGSERVRDSEKLKAFMHENMSGTG